MILRTGIEEAAMGEREHTPGPWRVTLDEFGDYTIQPEHAVLAVAAVVNGEMRRMGGHAGEHQANARLIAAAPDMFEALRLHKVYEALPTDRGGSDGPKGRARAAWIAARNAALSKAGGARG
jgi:hypothetical protein